MGEQVYLQFPLAGGLDEKTAATYLDPQQNQSSISNGNFEHVGAINKRFGIQADERFHPGLVILNPNNIVDPYISPATYVSALGALGASIFQTSRAWTLQAGVAAYAGKLPNVKAVRRPLPTRGLAPPIICDGVPALQGTVRAAAWISDPIAPIGASNWQINSAFLDPTTSQQLLTFPTLVIAGVNVTLVNLVWFPNTGALALFVVVEATGSASRQLRAYTITPANNSNVWTHQASADLALYNDDTTSLDVQPMVGDPSDGYIVLYLPSGASTTLNWRYFVAFASSSSSGALVTGSAPGDFPCHIVADWGIDVALVWSDNPSGTCILHLDYLSADGLFSTLASYNNPPSSTAALGSFAYTEWDLGGACRVYTMTNGTLNSEIYLAFWAQDTTYFSSLGPSMPVTMGGVVARSSTSVITPMGFVYYPYGLIPIARPMQMADAEQVAGTYIHLTHPCAQDYMLFTSDSVPIANVNASNPICEQVTEYLIDFRVQAEAGTPLALFATEATIVATVAPRQLDPYLERWSNDKFLPLCASSDRTRCLTPIVLSGSGISGLGVDVSSPWLVTFSVATGFGESQINESIEVSGAVPTRFGPLVVEHGFVNFPEFIVTSLATGTLTGTYGYAVVYGRQDKAGNIEMGSPVVLPAPVVLVSQECEVIFPKLAWTNDGGEYFVEIYRTLSLGSTYYLVARVDAGNFGAGPYGSYTDELADNVLAKAQILYTTGGVLDNVNPPAANLAIAHRGRYAIVDETLSQVWFTKGETEGEVLGFNEVLICPFIEGGDITALASMDDKFVVFKQNTIWIQYGDGPADTGQGSDWTIPQLVPTDVGCVSSVSLASIPAGILFYSGAGFHLLGRDTSVNYVGKSVQDTISTYSTCVASCVVPSAKQARFCMQANGGEQIILVFDYFLNQWSRHVYAHLDSAIVDLLLVNGVYTVITANGGRYQESSASYLDSDFSPASYFVPLSVTLPWIKISGPQGYQRARRVLVYAELEDAAGIEVSAAFNFDATVKQSQSWAYGELEGRPTEQVEMHMLAAFTKCESVQITLTDVDDAAKVTGQGMTFQAVGFELDKIGDRYRRLPARLKG